MNSQRLVLTSAARRPIHSSVVILVDNPNSSSNSLAALSRAPLGRRFQVLMLGCLVGALLHHLLGVGTALALTLLVLPVLAGVATLHWFGRQAREELSALGHAGSAALLAPLVVLPGALLGGLSLLLGAGAAATAGALVRRYATA